MLSATPVGSEPPVTVYVSGSASASVAASAVSGSPTVTVCAVFVRSAVKAGALFGSGLTVMLRLVVSQSVASHTSTVTVNGPSSVGVSLKVPFALRLTPVGRCHR